MNDQQRAAMQMALEALEHSSWCVQNNYLPDQCGHDWDEAITALREALAQPQGEPVACSKDAPVHIYLQTGCDDEDCECAFNEWGDVTWCGEKIHDSDIHYVRADTTPPSVEAAIEATKAKYEKKFDEVFGELIEKINGGMSAAAAIRSMK